MKIFQDQQLINYNIQNLLPTNKSDVFFKLWTLRTLLGFISILCDIKNRQLYLPGKDDINIKHFYFVQDSIAS